MEGITWIRISAIAALFLGSLYVLLPTAVQGDIETQRAAAAAAVEAPAGSKKGADLEVLFESADPEAAAEVLRTRLSAAEVGVTRVRVDSGQVEVTLSPGTHREDVVSVAARAGAATVYDPRAIAPAPDAIPALPEAAPLPESLWSALLEVDEPAAGWWGEALPRWYEAPVPDGVAPLGVDFVSLTDSTLKLSGPLPEGVPFAVLAVDGKMVATAFPAAGDYKLEPLTKRVMSSTGDEWPTPDGELGLLRAGPFPSPLTPVVEDAETPDDAGPVADAEPVLPPFVLNLLPDTVINLGLDLQGGLDITLQVELEDAVLSQVARDARAFKDAAERNDLELLSARKDQVEPLIWFELGPGVELTALQDFMSEQTRDYQYAVVGDDDRHGYAMTDVRQETVAKDAVDQVLETLRKRVDATGVKEPSIVKKPGGRINVQLPGAVDLQEAVDAIGTTAVLEFRMVDPAFDRSVLEQIIQSAEEALPPDQFADDDLVNQWLWDQDLLEEDRIVLWHYEETTEGERRLTYREGENEGPLPLVNQVELTGNDVNDASVGFDQNNFPYVALSFKPRGAQVFCDLTTEHVKERFAIILDNQIRSAPSIRERICGGRASIEMGGALDPIQDAQNLVLVLRTGSLDAPISVGEVRQVGASLGQDAIRSGGIASVVGFMVVLVFMGIWYRRSGLIADVALMLNVLLVLASLAVFGATLTLPGIAGIALTVGMAVDANIIIFERIREELEMGVHPRKAVDEGFKKGLVAVLDANITTAIAGIVLYSYGTGPIKGFAVTLLIGIVTTLVTALFVTRTLMEFATRSSSARITI